MESKTRLSKKIKKVRVLSITNESSKSQLAISAVPRISKLKGKALKTLFGQHSEKILQLLEAQDADPAMSLIYKRLLQSLVDLLPMAELAVRNSEGARGIYQLNQLVSSVRELMADIQSSQDRGLMGQAIVDSIIRPAFHDIATDIVQEYSMIGSDAKAGMTEKEWGRFQKALQESRARLAEKLNRQYATMKDGTISYLQR